MGKGGGTTRNSSANNPKGLSINQDKYGNEIALSGTVNDIPVDVKKGPDGRYYIEKNGQPMSDSNNKLLLFDTPEKAAKAVDLKVSNVSGEKNIKAINDSLIIVKGKALKELVFKTDDGKLAGYKSGAVLYHPTLGYVAFKNDNGLPYVPNGGAKTLQSVLDSGGFLNFDGMTFVKPYAKKKQK